MSWSIFYIGTPDKIVTALEKESERLTGQSKEEFDKVLPSLINLVQQNFDKNLPPAVKLSANGHGYLENGEPRYSTCNVSLENLGAVFL